MELENKYLAMAVDFFQTRKNNHLLTEILEALDNEEELDDCLPALEYLFSEVLQKRMLLVKPHENTNESSESGSNYVAWLRQSYELCWKKLLTLLTTTASKCVLDTLLKFIKLEGTHPIVSQPKKKYYFPNEKLKVVMVAFLRCNRNIDSIVDSMEDYSNYLDVVYYSWIEMTPVLEELLPFNERSFSNVLQFLITLPVPSENELISDQRDVLFCYAKNKAKFRGDYLDLKKAVTRCWSKIKGMCPPNVDTNDRQRMVSLLVDNLMDHLENPVLTLDFLMDSTDFGGPISITALQGIYTLVKDYNLEYPNIYGKLYSLFVFSNFGTRHKAKLMNLADLFLNSTHLPEALVASFAKRMARLCLVSPPHDVIVLLTFVRNLMIRHKGLLTMIHHPLQGDVSSDPFLCDENDAMETRAIESSLWEVKTLQQHVMPRVAKSACFINKQLPQVETDIKPLLEVTYDAVFQSELKPVIKNASITFEKPTGIFTPKSRSFLEQIWTR